MNSTTPSILCVTLLATLIMPAIGGLGDNFYQCKRRYGGPSGEPQPNAIDPKATDYRFILREGWTIRPNQVVDKDVEIVMTFQNDKVANMLIKRLDGEPLSELVGNYFMFDNGSGWRQSEFIADQRISRGGSERAQRVTNDQGVKGANLELWTDAWHRTLVEHEKRQQREKQE